MSFYGGGLVFPRPAAPATIPLVGGAAPVPPQSMPVGPVVSAPPAGFPLYRTSIEVMGAPINKGVVPGLFTGRTAASFMPPGSTSSVPVDTTSAPPKPGIMSMFPSPVAPIFRTRADALAINANASSVIAQESTRVAMDTAKKVDIAIFNANTAAAKSAAENSVAAKAAADAAAMRAKLAVDAANAAAQAAADHEAKAVSDAVAAALAADREQQAQDARAAANAQAIADADAKAWADPGLILLDGGGPSSLVQAQAQTSGGISPVVIGLGLLAVGGGIYFMARKKK